MILIVCISWKNKSVCMGSKLNFQYNTERYTTEINSNVYLYNIRFKKLHGYTVHQTMLKPFYYQLMHIMLKKHRVIKTF